MKTVAIMQPYFLPYLGYWQLIDAVDTFVIYDNIKFTKGGWINRNRILARGRSEMLTLPLARASDAAEICERLLVPEFGREAEKMLRRVRAAYSQAPHLEEGMALLERIVTYGSKDLFGLLAASIRVLASALGLRAEIISSSVISADHTKKGEARVIDICRALGADIYINPPGGRSLYTRSNFVDASLDLMFLEPKILPYKQHGVGCFVPDLSIIDPLMALGVGGVKAKLSERRIIA